LMHSQAAKKTENIVYPDFLLEPNGG
jgi:hypothetical protein